MALFNRFNDQSDNSPAKEEWQSAKEHLDNNEYHECLQALAWGFRKDVNYMPLFQLATDCMGAIGAVDEQKLFEAVCSNQNDAKAYYDLGKTYSSIEHYDLAQVFYEKALLLDPKNEELPHDLALCYARRFNVSKALEVLTNNPPNDFWGLYFLNKCKILNQKMDGVQEFVNDLMAFLQEQPDQERVAVAKMKIEELQETVQRYNTIPTIQTHIRDWQYIQYGSVVLDYFEDSEDYVAGGRYVASWGSMESIKMLASKFKQFVNKLSISIQSIVSLPGRDSEIIGRVLAKELGIGFSFYDPEEVNHQALIVAANSSYFDAYEELSTVNSGQILFAANHNWLASTMISPDIIGFMTQSYSFPWNGGGMRVTDTESGAVESIPPDDRSEEEIATDIFNIEPSSDNSNEHLEFYLAHKDYLKGIGTLSGNKRYNLMIESPVPGSYFG
ncbi:tetratricopeptide repeat protein [Flavisolibacter tropicus]|uniref:Uncharacterized protein n=1 Tax=Flavisolibacter tropicus TaxID=1492898 RepID=A0A172TYC3_9BACT|nr:tetratricopeptide repeat protein [Flavisolibacter tropicus]ANE52111.1 hypothetical protein SY85_18035 [Flavisolibacter tropicus]